MADNRPNEMSSSSSPTTSSSSPMMETNGTPNGNDSKANTPTNKDPLNAPKFGTLIPNRIFVGGIPTDTRESEVEQLFSKFGKVTSVKIINDRAGVPRGYGFVTFETEEDANKVIKESENLLLKNRKLNVSVAIRKQQHFNNEFTSRSFPNGSLLYAGGYLPPNAIYPDFNTVYTSDANLFYQSLGISPQLVANSPMTSPSGPYPYTYHASGIYLPTQPSMNPQMTPQFQSTASTYQLGNTSFARMPITSQNMNPNMNQVNPYLQLSNTTPPPLSQSSSMPIQVGTVANPMMATDNMSNALNGVNLGLSSLSLGQNVYIPSNMPNSTQSMACVQNVQLKADNGLDMCSDNSHLLSGQAPVSTPQMLELVPIGWQQRMPGFQSPNKPAMNRNQYSSKPQPSAANDYPNDRPDRRSNSSSIASHNRKSMGNSVNRSKPNGLGYGHNRNSNAFAAENQCQTVQNHNSIPNPSAFQGMPFVKHQYNNRYHTIPTVASQPPLTSQPSFPKMNGTIGQHRITKIVNGVEIFAVPNLSAGEPDGYGYVRTQPPMTGQRRCQNSSQK